MSQYPENERLEQAQAERLAVLDFMEWAEENGLQLMAVDDGRPYGVNVRDKIYAWLEIDQVALEQERRAMQAALRDMDTEGEA